MSNQLSTQQSQKAPNYQTALTKISNTYFPMIEKQLSGNGIQFDDYQKQCVMSSISAINTVLDTKGITWNDDGLDRNNITQVLLNVAALKLNAAASPREVYFQIRNVKFSIPNPGGGKPLDKWVKQIEMGIEGDGNDAILSNYGRNVKEVHKYWLVREGDEFVYPRYKGIELAPPEWAPKGTGKVLRVVYPITRESGETEYHIAEREDVIRNLIAHVKNNLMNETFGIAKDRYNATFEQKREIDKKKKEIINKFSSLGLDAALDDEELEKYISPAWKDPQSRESMIIRKMRNNIVKKIPKDFGNAFVSMTYNEVAEDTYSRVRKEVNENANQEVIDIPDEPKQDVSNAEKRQDPQIIDAEIVEPQSQPIQEKSEKDIEDEDVPF